MLYTFVEEQKKKKIHVAATYFVSGMCKSVNGCQVHGLTPLSFLCIFFLCKITTNKPAISSKQPVA